MSVYHRHPGFEAYSHFGESLTIGCLNGLMLKGGAGWVGGGAIAV